MNSAYLDKLMDFNEHELFYKEYYEANKNGTMDAFKKKYSPSYIKDHSLHCPEIVEYDLNPTGEIRFTDYDKQQDVILYKHPRYTPEFQHTHAYFEVFYVLKGQCHHTIKEEATIIKEGTLFFIAPNVYHSIGVFDDDSIVINFLINPEVLKSIFLYTASLESILSEFFLSNLYSEKNIEVLIFHDVHEHLKDIINSMLKEQFTKNYYYSPIINNLFSLFFYYLLRENKSHCDVKIISKFDNGLALKMLSYIYGNYTTVTLASLSVKFNYSIEHCSRLLKKELGKSFSQIIKEIKMNKAQELLLESNLSIEEICYEIGYESLSSFQRLFKKVHSITPGEYRNKKNNNIKNFNK